MTKSKLRLHHLQKTSQKGLWKTDRSWTSLAVPDAVVRNPHTYRLQCLLCLPACCSSAAERFMMDMEKYFAVKKGTFTWTKQARQRDNARYKKLMSLRSASKTSDENMPPLSKRQKLCTPSYSGGIVDFPAMLRQYAPKPAPNYTALVY